jgi:DNA invertase Pin-like site-specific DNA recombinase
MTFGSPVIGAKIVQVTRKANATPPISRCSSNPSKSGVVSDCFTLDQTALLKVFNNSSYLNTQVPIIYVGYAKPDEEDTNMVKPKLNVALYLRVSTNSQNTRRQEQELRDWASGAGHTVVDVFEDQLSGSLSSDKRPGLKAAMNAAVQRKFQVLAVWDLDRLGRDLRNMLNNIHDLQEVGVELYIHQKAIDTTTSAGRITLQAFGMLAEFERNQIQERVESGVNRMKDEIAKHGRYRTRKGTVLTRLGGTKTDPAKIAEIERLLRDGLSIRKAAAQTGVSVGTVHNVKKGVLAS